MAREYGLTDIDGGRPDWGKFDVDYSEVPQRLIEAMMDGILVQSAWLDVLSRRTRNFESAFLKQTAALRKTATD